MEQAILSNMKVSAIRETKTYKRLKDIVEKSRAAAQADLNMAKHAIRAKVSPFKPF